ncbi:MAG: hypothetical protein IJS08_12265 [Victivallales bacterium]|nr:hypothetical protein [Victivallales bacterium]
MVKVKTATIKRLVKLANRETMFCLTYALRNGYFQDKESVCSVEEASCLYEYLGRSLGADIAMDIARAAGTDFHFFQWHCLRLDELRNLPTGKALWWYKRKIKALLP